ncbi:MAG: ParB/RepB/Spo0J family partition protein [Salinisphaera sp.]|jgi:ParB/RepB/Spo0J family partition protein|nr:ParB/RepB/Spo0J family partition protein [Salinisphaera sp.]
MSTPISHANTPGARIRAARAALNLSQTELAERCSWPGDEGKARISRYERDVRTPSYTDAQALGRALRMSAHGLLTGDPDGVTVQQIPLSCIQRDINQPRHLESIDHTSEATQQLAQSIRAHGVLQPVTVRPDPGQHPEDDPHYIVIYGERRCRAAIEAHLSHIPAIVRTDIEDTDDRLAIQILENLQRLDLNLPELITGISQLAQTRTQDQIAAELGRSRAWVSRRASLHDCSAEVWQAIQDGLINDIDMAHAFEQLFEVNAGCAQSNLNSMRRIANGEIDQPQLTRAQIQDAVKECRRIEQDRTATQEKKAAAEREKAEAQRREEERANDTSSGYDGPLEDNSGQPAEVTGSEGQHEAERKAARKAAPDEPQDSHKRPWSERERQANQDAEEIQTAIGRPVKVEPLVIDPCLYVEIGNLSDADWQSLKAHLLRWRPPADSDLLSKHTPETTTGDEDPLYQEAEHSVRQQPTASISCLQRAINCSYWRAARLMDELQNNGVVSALKADGSRAVLAANGDQ